MKNSQKLASLLGIVALAGVTIHVLNTLINKKAASMKENSVETEFFSWRYGKIAYKKTGEGSPILLIHDLDPRSSSCEWDSVIEPLSNTHTVYAIDLAGCGMSERDNITYTNFFYVQLITEFAKSVIGAPTDVIASGLSGSFAVTACNYNKTLFNKVILVNPTSTAKLNRVPGNKSRAVKRLIELPLIGTMLYNMLMSKREIEDALKFDIIYDPANLDPSYIDTVYANAHRDKSKGKYLLASMEGQYINLNISHALKNIQNDIIIIGGEIEENIDETISIYKDINPSIESTIIANTMHLPHLEDADAFVKEIGTYL